MSSSTIAIIGAGHAGVHAATALRELQYPGRIVLIGDEPHLPYQRPPLSKSYLLGEADAQQLALRPSAFFSKFRIELLTGKRAVAIDRQRRRVHLDDATTVEFEHLVLATGASNRPLRVPGADLQNVFYLRTLADAAALRAQLGESRRAVVIGAGFVGLEFAAAAVKQDLDVTVLDIADRPLARAVSRPMARIIQREHETLGCRLHFDTTIARLLEEQGKVSGVEIANGCVLPADLVVVGIGVAPNVELAAACELAIDDGIVVDELLQTSDPHISAIGDVAAHLNPHTPGRRLRLESVQNASDQARCVAMRLAGKPEPYQALPWFWSHQAHLHLQIAGLLRSNCEAVVRGDANGARCSVFLFQAGKVVCVESLNRAGDHMLARRLLASAAPLTPQQAADVRFELKSLLPA